jgi:hypothetical protein
MSPNLDEAAIADYITQSFDGLDVMTVPGAWFFYYDPGRQLPVDRRLPFATIVTSDEYDQVSNLSRPGVFRLNIGIGKDAFEKLFPTLTSPSQVSAAVETDYDFTALDRIMPHPIYGNMRWICVLNPSSETFSTVESLLAEAHQMARRLHDRRTTSR